MSSRFDAVLFDVGGVLVLPDPTVLAPLLSYYGGADDVDSHRRAHYRAMAVKSAAGAGEAFWDEYNHEYVRTLGVAAGAEAAAAAEALNRTRSAILWRWPIPESMAVLAQLAARQVPLGIVSNASGQIEEMLLRSGIAQAGPGALIEMRVIIDSHVVGVAKPDPAIFEFALSHFREFPRQRIAYIGDSVTMDVGGATAAGLHPILLDPYDDHAGATFERITTLASLLDWV
jgi:FMN phosphatase YigB (HAD superfamily)